MINYKEQIIEYIKSVIKKTKDFKIGIEHEKFLFNKTNNEICKYIGAKSLKFLSLGGLYKAIGFDKRNETYPQLTDHYFTGDYPVKPIDELGDSKVTQLSLLSTASNN